jgi:hypothetical protein
MAYVAAIFAKYWEMAAIFGLQGMFCQHTQSLTWQPLLRADPFQYLYSQLIAQRALGLDFSRWLSLLRHFSKSS